MCRWSFKLTICWRQRRAVDEEWNDSHTSINFNFIQVRPYDERDEQDAARSWWVKFACETHLSHTNDLCCAWFSCRRFTPVSLGISLSREILSWYWATTEQNDDKRTEWNNNTGTVSTCHSNACAFVVIVFIIVMYVCCVTPARCKRTWIAVEKNYMTVNYPFLEKQRPWKDG